MSPTNLGNWTTIKSGDIVFTLYDTFVGNGVNINTTISSLAFPAAVNEYFVVSTIEGNITSSASDIYSSTNTTLVQSERAIQVSDRLSNLTYLILQSATKFVGFGNSLAIVDNILFVGTPTAGNLLYTWYRQLFRLTVCQEDKRDSFSCIHYFKRMQTWRKRLGVLRSVPSSLLMIVEC